MMEVWTMRRQTTGNYYSKVYIIIEVTAMGVTVFCVSFLLVLAIIFLVKYVKEKRTTDKRLAVTY